MDIYTIDYGDIPLSKMTPEDRKEALELIESIEILRKEMNIKTWFPKEGEFRRELYPKHLEFFAAGKDKTERLFLAANRTGKSVSASFELSCHLTGIYPDWWEGYRFTRGIRAWAVGKTAKTTRDICQFKMLGEPGMPGTGMIPKGTILGDPIPKPGTPKATEMIEVRHISGEKSILSFKSYDQGYESFMGTEMDVIWCDEECPQDVHLECLTRLMTTNGLYLLTFTPLAGLTEVVLSYLSADLKPKPLDHIAVVNCGWNDVPHLNEDQKNRLRAACPPHLVKAKSEGIPSIGAGAVYPIDPKDIWVDDFALPGHWPKSYGMDTGWNTTAAIWGSYDEDSDILYLYSEYYKGHAEPAVHVDGIRSRGDWLSGACDWAGINSTDGEKIIDKYVNLGLDVRPADKAVEAGLMAVWERMTTGRLKVFRSACPHFFDEFRLYQRDKNGKIVKKNDHLMDSMRYLVMAFREMGRCGPVKQFIRSRDNVVSITSSARWAM